MAKLCTDCKWCIVFEQGYSNWTVEGATAHCILKINPAGTFEPGWATLDGDVKHHTNDDAAANKCAENCPRYDATGGRTTVDVDYEEADHDYDDFIKYYIKDKEVLAYVLMHDMQNENDF